MTARTVPELAEYGPLRLPEFSQVTLPTGLTVIAVRRHLPLVDVRLRVPMAGAPPAPTALLAETLLAGTATKSSLEVAQELQEVGGQLVASVNADSLVVAGSALVAGLPRLLATLADALDTPAYPDDAVRTARDRVAHAMRVSKNQPGLLIHEELNRHIYPGHPYGVSMPSGAAIQAVDSAALRELHADRIHPVGATLVLVGDLDPAATLLAAEAACARWNRRGTETPIAPAPPVPAGPVRLVHRPGSVQSSIRLAMDGAGILNPDFPALQLANLMFGGYFSSRLVENLRERNGYTYSPHSTVLHTGAGSRVIASFDVANEVTAPALREARAELESLGTQPIDTAELERARRYALGTQRLALTTQAAVADLVLELDSHGASLDWAAGHLRSLETVGADEVGKAAARYLAPDTAATVILGDADAVHSGLAKLGPVLRHPAPANSVE